MSEQGMADESVAQPSAGTGTAEPVLELDGLTSGYNGSAVLRDIRLTVRPGEVVALLGANGAGKTTTLLTISGIVKPMAGRVLYQGDDCKGNPPDAATKKLVTPQVLRMAQVAGLGENHNITVGGIETAMDAFYGNYRNAPVCWKDALQFSIWSLSGAAPAEQELDSARKRGAESGCK